IASHLAEPARAIPPEAEPKLRCNPVAAPARTTFPLPETSIEIVDTGPPEKTIPPLASPVTEGVEPAAVPAKTIAAAVTVAVTIESPPKRKTSGSRNTMRRRKTLIDYATLGATLPALNWKVLDVLMVTSEVSCAYHRTFPALDASMTATNRIVPHPADAVGKVIVPEFD